MTLLRNILTIPLFAMAAAGAAAQAEEPTRSPLVEQLLLQQTYEVGAILRSDMARLNAIESFINTAIEREDTGKLRESLDRIEFVLRDLRLPGSEIAPVIASVDCLRAAENAGRALTSCDPQQSARDRSARRLNPTLTADSIVALSNRGSIVANPFGLRPQVAQPAALRPPAPRFTYAIAFYGQSVDLEIGRLFTLLAEEDPELLSPIPIDPGFQYAKCINGNFYPVVGPDVSGAAWRYKQMLAQTDEPHEMPGGEVFRFSMLQSGLAERLEKASGSYPDKLTEFTLDQAYDLSVDVFRQTYGFDRLSGDPALDALHALWSVLAEDAFLRVVSEFLGQDLAADGLGQALEATGLEGEALWQALYRSAGQSLHCSDADKVFEAYGLVYRRGDYPAARAVLGNLRNGLGFAAVPGVAITPVQRQFIESRRQNCALFGPVEYDYSGEDAEACNLGEVDLGKGRRQHVVLGGGAEIEFRVTAEERERLAGYLRRIEALPRGGDILRWSARGDAPIEPQALRSTLALARWDESREALPCVLGMSYYLDPSSTDEIVAHFEDYKRNFYPTTDGSLDGDNWQLVVIDEFGGFRKQDFSAKMLPLARELEGMLATLQAHSEDVELKLGTIIPQRNDGGAGGNAGGAGTTGLETIPADVDKLCSLLKRQIDAAQDAQKVSHGAFIKSLLVGASSSLHEIEGLGLLNAEGKLDEAFFEQRLITAASAGRIADVAEHVDNLGAAVSGPTGGNMDKPPLAVFNVSLGQSYLDAGGSVRTTAESAIRKLGTRFLTSNNALFVLAAGQPEVPPDAADARDVEAVSGTRLTRLPLPLEIDRIGVGTSDCSYFPSCFSALNNVITVGAVKPSPGGRRYSTAILMPWANYGSAVTVAAPGQSVLGNDYAYLPNGDNPLDKLRPLPFSSLRDGTSVATVFVTALAAKLASAYPAMTPAEIKMRLVSTVRPFLNTDGEEEILRGEQGQLFAGVIDPETALRDPRKYHVTFRTPRPDGSLTQTFDLVRRTAASNERENRPLWLFESTSTTERARGVCEWGRLLRLHFDEETETDDYLGQPIPQGAMACMTGDSIGDVTVGAGFFGTRDVKNNTCLSEGVCFEALSFDRNEKVDLQISDIRDIYFPVIR